MRFKLKRMDFTFINIRGIFLNQYNVLKSGGGSNFFIFIVLPIIVAVLSFFIKGTNDGLDSILSTSLSVFIGLFINLLLLVVSITKGFSRHKKELRIDVIEEMFYNITFVITIALIALILILFKNVILFPEDWTLCLFSIEFSLNLIFKNFFSFSFVCLFVEVILTIILILKRIFKLFEFDIDEIKNKINKENQK